MISDSAKAASQPSLCRAYHLGIQESIKKKNSLFQSLLVTLCLYLPQPAEQRAGIQSPWCYSLKEKRQKSGDFQGVEFLEQRTREEKIIERKSYRNLQKVSSCISLKFHKASQSTTAGERIIMGEKKMNSFWNSHRGRDGFILPGCRDSLDIWTPVEV